MEEDKNLPINCAMTGVSHCTLSSSSSSSSCACVSEKKGNDDGSKTELKIPVIDIHALMAKGEALSREDLEDPDIAAVVEQIDRACREIGFFYLIGHGVPQSVIDGARDVSRAFFSLPLEEKRKISFKNSPAYRGYQEMRDNVTEGKRDWHEAIDLYREIPEDDEDCKAGKPIHGPNQWPEKPENFRPLMEEYVETMKGLGRRVMQGIALALGGTACLFEEGRTDKSFWVMRVIGYPPLQDCCEDGNLVNGGNLQSESLATLSCGAHTDYGLLTMVNQDPHVCALQVKTKEGKWIWAGPIEGSFVVNIGDMLTAWTNGLYPATLHRVVNKNSRYRVSVPFFFEPNFDTVVEPLDICRDGGRQPALYSPVVYGEHLTKKVLSNFY